MEKGVRLGTRAIKALREQGTLLTILFTLLSLAGLLLLAIGEIGPAGRVANGLLVIGGTAFGAGFAALLAFRASQYSVLEGYRKEANLDRKDNLYGPLQSELRYLGEYLQEAEKGGNPYPQWIDIWGEPYPNDKYPAAFEILRLHQWPQFRASHHKDDFSPKAHKLLDDILGKANAYNSALLAARPIAQAVLKQAIQAEVTKVQSAPDYQNFAARFQQQIQQHYPVTEMLDTDEHKIYGFIAVGKSSRATPVDEDWSYGWLEALSQQQPVTLGWLLANRPESAASCVFIGLRQAPVLVVAPVTWFTDIFATVCKQLNDEATVKDAYKAAEDLIDHLKIAEHAIAKALQYIRERYQGGEPPF